MRVFFYNVISVIYTFFRFILIKVFHFKSFHFKGIARFSPNTEILINKGRMNIGKKVRAHRRTKIMVSNNGELSIGDNVAMNTGVGVYCFDNIFIGDNVEIGPDTKIYDHDHKFRCPDGYKKNEFVTSPVKIGNNVWIGCNCVLLRGTTVGDNCVIGAGCILKGNYPDNTLIVQKRKTELIQYELK